MSFFIEQPKILFKVLDHSFSTLSLSLLIPSFILIIFFGFYNLADLNKTKMQVFLDLIYEKLYNFLIGILKKPGKKYIPFFMSLIVFLLILNITSLIPWSFAATSQLFVNLTLAFLVFLLGMHAAIEKNGIKFLKYFIPNVPLVMKPFLFLLELNSFFIKHFVLAFRLCLNIGIGHLILHIFASIKMHYSLSLIILTIFNLFEIGVACLQVYIFTMLSCIYISDILQSEH